MALGIPLTKYNEPSGDMRSVLLGLCLRADSVKAVQVCAPPTGRHLTSILFLSEEKGISWMRWYIGRGSGIFAL